MLIFSLLFLWAFAAPVYSQQATNSTHGYPGSFIKNVCNVEYSGDVPKTPYTHWDVLVSIDLELTVAANITLPPEIHAGFHWETTFCVDWFSTAYETPMTFDSDSFHAAWKRTESPCLIEELQNIPGDPGYEVPLLHKNGTESYASSHAVACSTTGIAEAIDDACDKLTGKDEKAFAAKAKESVTITGKTKDPVRVVIQTLNATTIKKEECKTELTTLVDTYKGIVATGNSTGGWSYLQDGTVKISLLWVDRVMVTDAGTNETAYCWENKTALAGAKGKDGETSGAMGVVSGREMWWSAVAVGVVVLFIG